MPESEPSTDIAPAASCITRITVTAHRCWLSRSQIFPPRSPDWCPRFARFTLRCAVVRSVLLPSGLASEACCRARAALRAARLNKAGARSAHERCMHAHLPGPASPNVHHHATGDAPPPDADQHMLPGRYASSGTWYRALLGPQISRWWLAAIPHVDIWTEKS